MTEEKPYYSIAETARLFNVNTSLLRYWEKEFSQIKPYKNKKGDRYFTPKDIEIIQAIYQLTKVQGYTLQGAKDALKKGKNQDDQHTKTVNSLLKIKQQLMEIRDNL